MALFLDYAFVFVLGFVTGFTWTRYYVDDNALCILMGLLLALLTESAVRLLFKKYFGKKAAKKLRADKARGVAAMLQDSSAAIAALGAAYEKEGFEVSYYKIALLCQKDKESFFALTLFSPHSEQDACAALNLCKSSGVAWVKFFCASPSSAERYAFKRGIRVELLGVDECVSLLEKNGFQTEELPSLKEELPIALRKAFCRSRSKYYFISALFLAATSFIAFFPVYYILGATLLFGLSVYSRFNSSA